MIFISTPYTHRYKEVTDHRIKIVSFYAAHLLLDKGLVPISPVLLGDRIRQNVEMAGTFDAWDDLCSEYLIKSKEMHVLKLNGWKESKGIQAEIEFARRNNIPIKYIEFFQPIPDGHYHFREDEEFTQKEKFNTKLDDVVKSMHRNSNK